MKGGAGRASRGGTRHLQAAIPTLCLRSGGRSPDWRASCTTCHVIELGVDLHLPRTWRNKAEDGDAKGDGRFVVVDELHCSPPAKDPWVGPQARPPGKENRGRERRLTASHAVAEVANTGSMCFFLEPPPLLTRSWKLSSGGRSSAVRDGFSRILSRLPPPPSRKSGDRGLRSAVFSASHCPHREAIAIQQTPGTSSQGRHRTAVSPHAPPGMMGGGRSRAPGHHRRTSWCPGCNGRGVQRRCSVLPPPRRSPLEEASRVREVSNKVKGGQEGVAQRVRGRGESTQLSSPASSLTPY